MRRHRSQSHRVAVIVRQCFPTAPAETSRRCKYRWRLRFSRAVFYLIDLAALNSLLRCETETRLGGAGSVNHRRDILSDDWSMFEAMHGAATHDPNVVKLRMAIDYKASVRRVLILAN